MDLLYSEDSARMSLIHAYKRTLRGFAAMLTTKEADILSSKLFSLILMRLLILEAVA